MNFKRNCLVISALVGTVLVSGCSLRNAFVEYKYSELAVDLHEEETKCDGALVKKGNYDDYFAIDKTDPVNVGSFYDVMTNNANLHVLPSEGEQKILVIPVEFEDEGTVSNYLGIKKEEYIENIRKAFFGSSKNNSYVSVAEYYDISSYGKLKITGKVCDEIYTMPYHINDILSKPDSVNTRDYVSDEYEKIVNWYDSLYHDIDSFKAQTGLKGDHDVPIYLVYDYPAVVSEKPYNMFWNYTFREKNISWTSYQSLNVHKRKVDAHTLIHEVGHLLGLVDYYPTVTGTKSDNIIEPVRCIDMMDCSLGDHTGLSKMLLNWTRPYQVKDSCEISLKSFTESGELLLLNDNWNGTVFDEYYLVEFYTPTALNTFDVAYGNSRAKLPQLPGIKLYHVDANLGFYTYDRQKGDIFKCGANEEGYALNSTKLNFIHDNNSYRVDGENGKTYNNYLYELVLKHTGASSVAITDEYLYHTGDTISSFRFSGNHEANYTISITGMNYSEATLKITKN